VDSTAARYLRFFGDLKLEPELRAGAFWIVHDFLFKDTPKCLHRNPWTERQILALCQHRNLAFSGCASSGKTTSSAVYGFLMWLARPHETKVMVTSTEMKGARGRIWGQIKEFWMAASSKCDMPGKLVDSLGLIVLDMEDADIFSDRSGIQLYAGEPKKSNDAIQKWIGMKSKRVILILDEMPYLGPQLLQATSNLGSNPFFQLVGLGNFSSKLDPFGQFTTPLKGWESIDIETEEYETICDGQNGYCIRFDGVKSPNVLAGEDIYESLYSNELYRKHLALGINSPRFWQMCRSYPSPVGVSSSIYSEAHFDMSNQKEPVWLTQPIMLASLDPGFTNGGDRSLAYIMKYGNTAAGRPHLHIIDRKELKSDATMKNVPHDYQIARAFRDLCRAHRVKPKNAGVDGTGSGSSFHSIVTQEWSPEVIKVIFGGDASELPAHENDYLPGNEVYDNRVSELWDQGKEYFVQRMITGVSNDLMKELCSRNYHEKPTRKIRVESKKDMKKRGLASPDEADSFCIGLEIARVRFAFFPKKATIQPVGPTKPLGDGGYLNGVDGNTDDTLEHAETGAPDEFPQRWLDEMGDIYGHNHFSEHYF
jgi:hypothetical protein